MRRETIENVGWERGRRGGDWHCNICRLESVQFNYGQLNGDQTSCWRCADARLEGVRCVLRSGRGIRQAVFL